LKEISMGIEPNYAAAKRLLEHGHMLASAHRHLDAASVYRQALNHCPYLREAHLALACYYEQCGLLTRAADSLRSASQLQADLPILFQLAQLLSKLEQHHEALEVYQRCLALAPNSSMLRYEILRTRCHLGEHTLLLTELDHTSDLRTWQVESLRGACFEALQRYDEARQAFQKALDDSDQNPILETLATDLARIDQQQRQQQRLPQTLAQTSPIYLGATCEDGLPRPIESHYHFTYPDIARSVHCFQTLYRQGDWSWNAIVSLDKTSQPLANAIAQSCELPLRSLSELQPTDSALIVATSSQNCDIFRLATERIPCACTSFCLSIQELPNQQLVPDIIGIISKHHPSLPWEAELRKLRSTAAPVEWISACLSHASESIVQAFKALAADPQPLQAPRPSRPNPNRSQITPA
jgi:tetratricopeptide (TPR) repeat protein